MTNNSSITIPNRKSAKPTQRKAGAAQKRNPTLPQSVGHLGTNKNGVKITGMKKRKPPGGNQMFLGTHWRWQIEAMQKETVTYDAPSCLMTIRNLGPAMVEV